MPRHVKVAPRRKSEYLPNASTLGYGKFRAFPGDFVTFHEEISNGNRVAMGRVIGVIDETDSQGVNGAGMLLVLMISQDHTHGYENWITLDRVITCVDVEHARHFMAWFLNADTKALMAYRNDDLETRKAATYYPDAPTKKG